MPDIPTIPQQRAAAARLQPPRPPRVTTMIECRGDHTQTLLFHPEADETMCRDCRHEQAQAAHAESTTRGAAAARAALRGTTA